MLPVYGLDIIVEYIFFPLNYNAAPVAYRCYVQKTKPLEIASFLLGECSRRTGVPEDDLALLNLMDGKPCQISQLHPNVSKICIYQLKSAENKKTQKIYVVNILSLNGIVNTPLVFSSDENKETVCLFY